MTDAPVASRVSVSASRASAATRVTSAGPEPLRLTTLTGSPRSASNWATRPPITPAPMTRCDIWHLLATIALNPVNRDALGLGRAQHGLPHARSSTLEI